MCLIVSFLLVFMRCETYQLLAYSPPGMSLYNGSLLISLIHINPETSLNSVNDNFPSWVDLFLFLSKFNKNALCDSFFFYLKSLSLLISSRFLEIVSHEQLPCLLTAHLQKPVFSQISLRV